ncbi:MAG: tetratricopeptide repeat protein [Magnetococcales bacterium]|nr:tetratricopeptide repeat protein [Magnetococcales bacterium]
MTWEHTGKGGQQGPSPPDPECRAKVVAFISQRTGIVIRPHQLDNLNETLAALYERFNLADCQALLNHFQNLPDTSPELEFLISRITVGESYFFRDENQIAFLRDTWLPQTVAAKREAGELSLRIWSAGCSNGQEVVTLAILLQETIPDHPLWKIHLLGSDINTNSLSQAMIGRYPEWSFRATPMTLRQRYFISENNAWRVNETIRSMSQFAYLNLVDDTFPSVLSQTNGLDLILCRNVFIYFDPETVRRVLAKFVDCLVPGGYLILGASDLVLDQVPGCEARLHGDHLYFRKLTEAESSPPAQPSWQEISSPRSSPGWKGKSPPTSTTALKESWPPSAKPGKRSSAQPLPPASKVGIFTATQAPSTPDTPALLDPSTTRGTASTRQQLITRLAREEWQEALAELEQLAEGEKQHPLMGQFQAKIMANLGQMDQALELCQTAIAADPTDKHIYLIQGQAFLEAGRFGEAEKSLRRGIFLDRGFVECHFHLGMHLIQSKRRQAGIKALKNAARAIQSGHPDWQVHNARAISYSQLASVLQKELSVYDP